MTIKERVDASPIYWLSASLLAGFLAGLGTFKGIVEIAQLQIVPRSQSFEQMKARVSELEFLNSDLDEQLEKVRALNSELESKLKSTEERLMGLTASTAGSERSESDFRELRVQLDAEIARRETLAAREERTMKEIGELKLEMQKERSEVSKKDAELLTLRTQLDSEIAERRAAISDAEKLQNEITSLREQLSEMEIGISELDEFVDITERKPRTISGQLKRGNPFPVGLPQGDLGVKLSRLRITYPDLENEDRSRTFRSPPPKSKSYSFSRKAGEGPFGDVKYYYEPTVTDDPTVIKICLSFTLHEKPRFLQTALEAFEGFDYTSTDLGRDIEWHNIEGYKVTVGRRYCITRATLAGEDRANDDEKE